MEDRTNPPERRETALITMGGQAQVVTFALDALLARGHPIGAALVLHMAPDDPRVRRALAQVSREFAGGRYAGRPMTFRHLAAADGERPLAAVRDEAEAEAAWHTARNLLAQLKATGDGLHLCIAGGPRMLALTLTSAALLQCGHRDQIWHLYTPRAFLQRARDGAILHAPPDAGVQLVPVPFAPWGAYFPTLRTLSQPEGNPANALDPADAARCRAVWQRLTQRQRDVARALAEGLTPQEAADALVISLKTLDSHKTEILAECRVAWAMAEDAWLTYHFLHDQFGPWLTLHPADQGST
jgi:CRISPR-associated protein Csx14